VISEEFTANGSGAQAASRRALVYGRVSTDEQAEKGYSLSEQEQKGAHFSQANGWQVVEEITDDFTGRRLDRPGLNRISELAQARAFDVLVVVRTDRLARKNHLRRTYEEWLEKRGIEVRYVDQRLENTCSGRLQKGIQGEIDEADTERIRENTMMGRRKKAENGAMPCKVRTYGYHQITAAEAAVLPQYRGKSGHLVVIKEEARLVRTIFELYASGRSVHGVVTWLRDSGYRSRNGVLFTYPTVRSMLRSETYCGRLYFGRRTCRRNDLPEEGEPKVFITDNPREEWREIPVPRIIPQELFSAVQERLDESRENYRGRPSADWPLTGILFCMDCQGKKGEPRRWVGGASTPKGRRARRYTCSMRSTPTVPFCGGTFCANRLEAMALDALRRIAAPDYLEAFARADAARRHQEAGAPARDTADLQKALDENTAKLGRVSDLILAGVPPAVVDEKIRELNEERERLREALALARTRVAWPDADTAAQVARQAADYLRNELTEAEADPARLRELFRLFLEIRLGKRREPEIRPRIPYLAEYGSNFLN
jgi:site-specific DNA recombinase